jgi:multiple sugar transport system permease protein
MSTDLATWPALTQRIPRPARRALRTTRRIGVVLSWTALTVAALAMMVPFIWMISVALRTPADLYAHPAGLWPHHWSLGGVHSIVTELPFGRLVLNTFVFAGGTTLLLLWFDSMTAFALARLRFRGNRVVFLVIIATLMVPFQVTIIPVFLTVFHLGWLNTFHGLIIPRATSALGIFLLRQFFLAIPTELDDAARVDGANNWHLYTRIILPLAKPALASLFVIQFMALWNDFLWPLVISSTIDMRTLPAALTLFQSEAGVDHAALMAGAAISIAPLAIAFLLAQRFFIQGVASTGVKS